MVSLEIGMASRSVVLLWVTFLSSGVMEAVAGYSPKKQYKSHLTSQI